jgi:hypothetical protein
MQRITTISIVLLSLFLITLSANAVACLTDPEPLTEPDFDALLTGNLHRLFLTRSFWKIYPSLPRVTALLYLPVLFLTGALVLGIFDFFALKKKMPLAYVGLVSLAAGLAIYLVAMLVLAAFAHNLTAGTCGKCVAVMLLAVLYSSIACLLCAVLHLFKIDIDTLSRHLSIHPHSLYPTTHKS